jgi:hypothetical protein
MQTADKPPVKNRVLAAASAVAIHSTILLPNSGVMAGNLIKLAAYYREKGKYALAGALYQCGFAIWQKLLEQEHRPLPGIAATAATSAEPLLNGLSRPRWSAPASPASIRLTGAPRY